MKILILYTYNQSFLSSFFKELALQLSQREHQVKIISFKKQPKVIQISSTFKIEILKKESKLKNYISIFKQIRAEKPDAVISNFSYVNPAVLCGRLLGVKKNIVWYHTLSEALGTKRKQIFIKSLFLKLASGIIVNSDALKEDVKISYGIDPVKLVSIPFWSSLYNGSEIQRERTNDKIFAIGCPARIEKLKNQELIIDSLAALNTDRNWKLYFAGNGDNIGNLKNMIKHNNFQDKVEFLGVLDMEKMKDFYAKMDLVILPSLFDAFGLVLIEALSAGCPVLVSNKFGALTYIADKSFLERYSFDPSDTEELTKKLTHIFSGEVETSEYFRQIYATYFQKEKIIAGVERVLHS